MENLVSRNWHRLPFITRSSFPVVHVDTLTGAIVKALEKPGAYIVSDQMTSLCGPDHAQADLVVYPADSPALNRHGGHLPHRGDRPDHEGQAVRFGGADGVSHQGLETERAGPLRCSPGSRCRWRRASGGSCRRGGRRTPTGRPPSPREGPDASAADSEAGASDGRRAHPLLDLVFTVGVASENPPVGYFVFQNTFTYADLILAVFTRAATLLLRPDPIQRVLGRGLSLVARGAAGPGRIGHQLQLAERGLPDAVLRHVPGGGDQYLVPGVWIFLLACEFAFDPY